MYVKDEGDKDICRTIRMGYGEDSKRRRVDRSVRRVALW